MDGLYSPTETHRSLFEKIDHLTNDLSYAAIGRLLLQDKPTSSTKNIVWKIHKKNEFPKDNEIRMLLGLPRLVLRQENEVSEICPTCGGAHGYDCGQQRPTARPGTKPPRARASVNLLDARSAAMTLINKATNQQVGPEFIETLADLLSASLVP